MDIPRVLEGDDISELVGMTEYILAIPSCLVSEVDALVVFPGLGETWRITHAIYAWEHLAEKARFFLVAGQNTIKELISEPLTIGRLGLPPYKLTRLDGVRSQVFANHSRHQAEWVREQIGELQISSLALFTPPYHFARAYLTVLRALIEEDIKIVLIPVPTLVPPHAQIPETKSSAWGMVAGEVHRIKEYQALGHVALFDQLVQYLEWLWEQPMFANLLWRPLPPGMVSPG